MSIDNEQSAPWAAFFKGTWLWEHAAPWDPRAERGASGRHFGATQKFIDHRGESPNFNRQIRVPTVIAPEGGRSDLEPETAMMILLADLEDELIDASDSPGPLCWAQNQEDRATVIGSHAASGANVTHGAVGGNWSRTAGQYVLCRQPTSGAGFLAVAGTVDSGGDDRVILTEAEAGTWQTLDATWELRYVQIAFLKAEFQRMSATNPQRLSTKAYRMQVEYLFDVAEATLWASMHAPSRGNSI